MENRLERSNSSVISKMMSNDFEIDAVHPYPICTHVPHVRKPPAKKENKKEQTNVKLNQCNW